MKKFLFAIFMLASIICLTLGVSACGGGSTEGTYYLVQGNEYDMEAYFVLKNGEWTDEDGVSGEYDVNGDTITLYTDLFGEKVEFTSGTIKDGVLTLRDVYGDKVFAKEGAWKGASGSGSGSQTPSTKEYTVTYDANGGEFVGGESTSTQTVKEGAKLTAPTSPTRKNYSFAGWAKSRSGSTMWKFDEDVVSENTTLFAQWTQESAVILSVEGASIDGREIFMLVDHTTGEVSLSSMVVCSDDSIWRLYSDPEGQREIPTKMVTNLNNGDNEYYIVVNSQNQAQVNVYKLTVHRSYLVTVSYYDGESLLETTETYTGDDFTASYIPDITGYTFNGWKKGGSAFTSAVLWAPLSLYADKTANTYKVTLDVNKGDELSETEKTMTYDKTYSLPVPKRTGYSFTGWYVGSTQITNEYGTSLTAWNYASAQNVTAHWQANDYAVTLKQNDEEAGTVSGGGDHAYDSQVTITATTNTGYNFLGWYDKDDELVTDKAQYTFKMGFAVTYTAKWDYYTLTATRNDEYAGTLSNYYTEGKISVGTKVTLTATTNKGYTWVGWYKGEDEVSKDLTYQYTMTKENVTFEARWSKVTLSVNNSNAGNVKQLTDTYKVGDEVTLTATTNMGYTWVGWYKGEEEVSKELTYQYTMTKENVTFEARWTYYTLTTKVNNSSAGFLQQTYNNTKVTAGEQVALTATTNKGYTWVGWYKGEDEVSKDLTYQYTMTKENVTFEARWIACPVTVQSNNETAGTVKMSDTTIIGQEVSLTATTNRGYTFVGWYKGEEEVSTELIYQYTMTKENVIFEARWSKVTLSVNDSHAGSVKQLTDTYKVGDEVTLTATTNVGYTWVGWYKGDDEVSKDLTYQYTMTKENVTFEARWTLDPAMADFKFSSTPTTCTITGVNDTSKTEYMIPDYVTEVKGGAFSGCSGLTSITIPDSVTSIGSSAFYGCSGLTGVYITDLSAWCKIDFGDSSANPLYYAQHLYLDNVEVKELTVPNEITEIKPYAFYDCEGLTSITIPDSVTSIGYRAFYGCSGLTGVHITDLSAWCRIDFRSNDANPLSYAHHLYVENVELKELTIPNGITKIKFCAFYGCSRLQSVTIGSGVTSIGAWAFDGCSGLTDIQYKGTVQEWNSIQKGEGWNVETGNYTVTCTDGTIDKEGNVTYFEE